MSENRSEQFWKRLPSSIHWEELAVITDLTKQRIWQLQKAGVIPAPDRGVFPFKQTMLDIFKYYRGKSAATLEAASSQSRIKEADAVLKENAVRRELDELVDVVDLAERMGRPLEAMRKLILDNNDLNKEQKDDLLLQVQQLYGSIFGERPRSTKLLELLKRKGIKL